MSDDRDLLEQALDLVVYAPLGLALEARDLVPKLVERGRGQVALTRLAGRFAADKGRDRARQVVGDLLDSDSGPVSMPTPPWPGYDELKARDIVARLDETTAPALIDSVLEYEQRHRRRATILARIEQLRN